jgi:hypothetical protein
MMIDVALSKRGAEPTHERASTGVRRQGGSALPVALGETEEFGVEGIGKVFAE